MGRIRLFRLLFQNGCSQSSRFLLQARRIIGSGDENGNCVENYQIDLFSLHTHHMELNQLMASWLLPVVSDIVDLFRLRDRTDLNCVPDHVLLNIFSYLNVRSLCQSSQVSFTDKSWK